MELIIDFSSDLQNEKYNIFIDTVHKFSLKKEQGHPILVSGRCLSEEIRPATKEKRGFGDKGKKCNN